MKTLDDFNVKDKFVLLRVDINSDVKEKKVIISERLEQAAQTIEYLRNKNAKVVVIAHQGNKGKDDFYNFKQHTKLLNKFTLIKYIEDIVGKKAVDSINRLKSGEAILLDNLRFLDEEQNPDKRNNRLMKILPPLFDLYVNDAFSVCHRDHTSITRLPKKIPNCAGLLVKKELDALEKISIKDAVYVLAGAKPETNIKLLKGNKVLACGLFGHTCLMATGKKLGYQDEFIKTEALIEGGKEKLLSKLKKKLDNVELPVDLAVRVNNKRKEFDLKDFPMNYQIDDIGIKTIKKYKKIIKNAPAVYMKGVAGFSHDKAFSKGTVQLLKAIANSKCYSLIGGGHTSDAIDQYKLPKKKFNHISLSGGALLSYVAGEKLVGLKALGYY